MTTINANIVRCEVPAHVLRVASPCVVSCRVVSSLCLPRKKSAAASRLAYVLRCALCIAMGARCIRAHTCVRALEYDASFALGYDSIAIQMLGASTLSDSIARLGVHLWATLITNRKHLTHTNTHGSFSILHTISLQTILIAD